MLSQTRVRKSICFGFIGSTTSAMVAIALSLGSIVGLGLESAHALSLPVLRGSVSIGAQPSHQIGINTVTHRVYIAGSYAQGGLTVVDASDPDTPIVMTTVPSGGGVAANAVTNRFYTSNGYAGQFLVYDGATNALLQSVSIGFCGGHLAVDDVANVVYMLSQCGGFNDPMHVLDGATNSVAAGPIGTVGVSSHVLKNPATGYVYAGNAHPPSYAPFTRVFDASIPPAVITDLSGYVRAINPLTNRVYVETASPGNEVLVLDGSTHALVATVSGAGVGNNAVTYGMNTTLNRVYIPDPANGNVKVVDGASNTVIGTFSLGAGVVSTVAVNVDSANNLIYIVGTDAAGVKKLYVLQDGAVTPEQHIQNLLSQVESLTPATLNSGRADSLSTKLENALKSLVKNDGAAKNQLQAFINQVQALMSAGILTSGQGQPLIAAAQSAIAAVDG